LGRRRLAGGRSDDHDEVRPLVFDGGSSEKTTILRSVDPPTLARRGEASRHRRCPVQRNVQSPTWVTQDSRRPLTDEAQRRPSAVFFCFPDGAAQLL